MATAPAGRLSPQDRAWIEAFDNLSAQLLDPFSGSPAPTAKTMTQHDIQVDAQRLRGCSQVYVLVQKACQQFDKAAGCEDTMASIPAGLPAGDPRIQQATEAGDCATGAMLDGDNRLAEAKSAIVQVRLDSGDA
jgi:hypothetical protein